MRRGKVIASCSCGKDSLAMTYESIDRGLLREGDEIVFYSNGMDFKCIYKLWDDLKQYAEPRGIKCTELKPECPFLYKMYDILVKNRDGSGYHHGYSWCGGTCRWGTTDKIKTCDRYFQGNGDIFLVGIAYDEPARLAKERASYKRFPLAEWKWVEQDCLENCRKRGIKWLEWSDRLHDYIDLYDILDRVSCWCCRNKNQWELYNIWYYFPDTYWKALLEMEDKLAMPFKTPNKGGKYGYTLRELGQRFESGFIPKHRKMRGDK